MSDMAGTQSKRYTMKLAEKPPKKKPLARPRRNPPRHEREKEDEAPVRQRPQRTHEQRLRKDNGSKGATPSYDAFFATWLPVCTRSHGALVALCSTPRSV